MKSTPHLPPIGSVEPHTIDSRNGTFHLDLEMLDSARKPYSNKHYLLEVDELRIEGQTDSSGRLVVDVPTSSRGGILTLWIGVYPGGEQEKYKINLSGLDPVDTPRGAAQRLSNLGYFRGDMPSTITPNLSEAIRRFQIDHPRVGVRVTGYLDTPTIELLRQVHGS
ncbi:peptidoglycan-binding protein [Pendulispora rubella]|uniref:Peptidoglycan-binding protein n=1 Tax=Pendulispora rubella TaxID=2741070 RepID=A0ABZ2KYP0_9BACT